MGSAMADDQWTAEEVEQISNLVDLAGEHIAQWAADRLIPLEEMGIETAAAVQFLWGQAAAEHHDPTVVAAAVGESVGILARICVIHRPGMVN